MLGEVGPAANHYAKGRHRDLFLKKIKKKMAQSLLQFLAFTHLS